MPVTYLDPMNPAPPVTSSRTSGSQLDIGVVAHDQPGPRRWVLAPDGGLPANDRPADIADVAERGAFQHDRLGDADLGQRAIRGYGRVRAQIALPHDGPGAQRHRPFQPRPDHLRAGLDDHRPGDPGE